MNDVTSETVEMTGSGFVPISAEHFHVFASCLNFTLGVLERIEMEDTLSSADLRDFARRLNLLPPSLVLTPEFADLANELRNSQVADPAEEEAEAETVAA